MRLRFHKRIDVTIYFLIFLIISLSVFLTTYLFLKKQEDFFISSLKKNGQSLGKTLARDSRYGVVTGDRKNLESYISGILTSENVTMIFIEDIKRNILLVKSQYHEDTRYYGDMIRASQAIQGHLAEGEEQKNFDFIYHENKKFITFVEPIEIEKKTPLKYFVDPSIPNNEKILLMGYVHVVFSLQEIENKLAESKKDAFLLSLFLFLIFFILAVFFSKKVVRPVYDLIEATQHVAEGDFDYKPAHTPDNEIGVLSESFFKMALSLKEKHALEERVFAMEKIASLGRLAGGVSHEFNNILTSISTEAEASLDINERDYYKQSMENVLDSAKAAATITDNLLNFAKPVKPVRKKISIKTVLEKSLKLIKQEMNNFGIKITIEIASDVHPCFVDPQQIQQVFINLLANARDAMRNGGMLHISISNERDFVRISFSDTGPGISPSDQEKIFEPFFTTKADYGKSKIPGTGLGLTVSSDIIKSHGGKIVIESKKNEGAVFLVWLPAVNK